MKRILSIVMLFHALQAYAEDPKDPLQLYREAIKSPERDNYVLSFDITYPVSKKSKIDERLKREYVIRVRGDERYSIITRYFKDKETDNKKYTSHWFILPALTISYDTGPFHLECYTTPRPIYHDHNIDYRKLGRLYSLGVSNGIPLSEYDRFFTIPFVKKMINASEIEYTARANYPEEKREYSLLFKDGNTAYPAISKRVIQAKSGTTEVVHLVKCGNDKSFPTEIDYMERHNGELIDHQCIRNIKFSPLPADFVFTPTLLNIPINAEAIQDRKRTVYWDGRKFVNDRVPVGR